MKSFFIHVLVSEKQRLIVVGRTSNPHRSVEREKAKHGQDLDVVAFVPDARWHEADPWQVLFFGSRGFIPAHGKRFILDDISQEVVSRSRALSIEPGKAMAKLSKAKSEPMVRYRVWNLFGYDHDEPPRIDTVTIPRPESAAGKHTMEYTYPTEKDAVIAYLCASDNEIHKSILSEMALLLRKFKTREKQQSYLSELAKLDLEKEQTPDLDDVLRCIQEEWRNDGHFRAWIGHVCVTLQKQRANKSTQLPGS